MLDFAHAVELVGGFFIFKFCLKIALPFVIARKGVALCLHARRVQRDKLLGDVLDRGLDLRLCLLPVARAEAVEAHTGIFLRADVFRDHVQLGDRHIEHIALGIVDFDVVLGNAVGVDFADAAEHADTVNAVYHIIARAQLGQAVDLLPLLFAAALLFGTVCRLSVADQEKLFRGQLKARAQRTLRHIDPAALRSWERVGVFRRVAVVFQAVREVARRLVGAREHHTAAVGGIQTAQVLRELLIGAVPAAELLGGEVDDVAERQRNTAVDKALQHRHAVRTEALQAFGEGQRKTVEALGEHAVLQRLLELLAVLVVRRLAAVAHIIEFRHEQQAVAGDVVEQALGLVIYLINEFVGVGEDSAAAQPLRLLVEPFARLGGSLAAQKPRLTDDLICQRLTVADNDFRGGRQVNVFRPFEPPLRLQIEVAEVAYLVAPKLRAHGVVAVGHEKVENAAAQRELSAAVHRVKALVAEERQRAHRLFNGYLAALLQL